jgi:hypothetical protein
MTGMREAGERRHVGRNQGNCVHVRLSRRNLRQWMRPRERTLKVPDAQGRERRVSGRESRMMRTVRGRDGQRVCKPIAELRMARGPAPSYA